MIGRRFRLDWKCDTCTVSKSQPRRTHERVFAIAIDALSTFVPSVLLSFVLFEFQILEVKDVILQVEFKFEQVALGRLLVVLHCALSYVNLHLP